MDIKYVKYTRERKPIYQIETIIACEEKKLFVRKKALTKLAVRHIQNIYNNYILLSKYYKNKTFIKIVPAEIEQDQIFFEYVHGLSYHKMIWKSVDSKDLVGFRCILDKYLDFIYSLSKREPSYKSCNKFIDYFGRSYEGQNICVLSMANIDLTLENIIIDEDGTHVIIDYEWVLDFPVPVKFVIYRGIQQLYQRIKDSMPEISFKDLLDFVEINANETLVFEEMEQHFYSNIFEKEKYSQYLQPHSNLTQLLGNYNELQGLYAVNQIINRNARLIQEDYLKLNLELCDNNIPIYIWGTGKAGEQTYFLLKDLNKNIQGFIDIDVQKWNKDYKGYVVFPPSILTNLKKFYVVIGSSYYPEISVELEKLGFKKNVDYCCGIIN